MGRLTKRINAEIAKGLTYEAIIYKDIEHHETDFNYEALNKLAHYEDLEEQGRLIEQKHGTWISLDTYVYECDGMWECSECGEDFYFEFGTPLECRAYYCPNCGAKMELKGE